MRWDSGWAGDSIRVRAGGYKSHGDDFEPVCDALAKPLGAGPCACRETAVPNDIAKWAMPEAPSPKPPCLPHAVASTLFSVKRGTESVEGSIVVRPKELEVRLVVRGATWRRLLAANEH